MNYTEKIFHYNDQLKTLKVLNDLSFEEEMLSIPAIQMCTLRVASLRGLGGFKNKN